MQHYSGESSSPGLTNITANEIDFLFVGENTAGTDDKKMRQPIQRKIHRKANAAKTGSVTQPGKRGPSDVQKNNSIKVKIFFAQPACPVGQKTLSSAF